MRFPKLFALTLATLSFSVAHASTPDSGTYLDLNVGPLYESINFFGVQYTAFGNVGLNTNLGYQFNRNFATELGYTAYGIDHHVINNLDLALKVILPVTEGEHAVSLFAKTGPAFLFAGGDNTGALLVGVGGAYQINQKVDFTMQAQGITQGFFNLGLLSAGITYHF
jgi:hypothetical protein